MQRTIDGKVRETLDGKLRWVAREFLFAVLLVVISFCFLTKTAFAGTWQRDGRGWWWQEDDGAYPVSAWRQIEGLWYYFDGNGYMAESQWIDGKYYVGADGAMLTDTITPDGYRVGSDGAWISGTGDANQNGQQEATAVSVTLNRAKADAALSVHNYYKNVTAQQAAEADAVAMDIASRILSDSSLKTDLDRVGMAAAIVSEYCGKCRYENDANKYYRSPYGVFVAGVYTCAGSTRAVGRVLDFLGYDWAHANENGWTHQWNILTMDGQTGYADGQVGWAGYGGHPAAS